MALLTRFVNIFRARALEQELDDELRFHLDQRIARNIEQGMNREQAETAAHEQFGNVRQVKSEMREIRMLNRPFVAGLMAGLLLAGIPAGLLWLHAGHKPQIEMAYTCRGCPPPLQAPRNLSTNTPAPAESSTICGSILPATRALPPKGTGPVLY
jgi:hypothetical protein